VWKFLESANTGGDWLDFNGRTTNRSSASQSMGNIKILHYLAVFALGLLVTTKCSLGVNLSRGDHLALGSPHRRLLEPPDLSSGAVALFISGSDSGLLVVKMLAASYS
jgi:hypothetical protein